MKTKFFVPILVTLLLLSFTSVVVEAQVRPSTGGGTNTSGSTGTGSNTSGSSGTGSNTSGSSGSGSNAISINIENPFRGCNSDNSCTIQGLFKAIIDNILIPIGSILVVLAFIFAGFKYVMAQGNPTKIEEAHRAFLYSAIGTVLILGAWVISTVIETTINQLRT